VNLLACTTRVHRVRVFDDMERIEQIIS
jgi:hypothetical protein